MRKLIVLINKMCLDLADEISDYRTRTDFNNQDEEEMVEDHAKAVVETYLSHHYGKKIAEVIAKESVKKLYGKPIRDN